MSLSERFRAAKEGGHLTRLVKFGAVSVISTVVTQGVLYLTYDVLTVGPAMTCNVIATAVATVPAYWLNRNWTWGKRGRSNWWREVAPFWIIAFVGLVLSTLAVGFAAHNADSWSQSHVMRRLIVQFANLVTYGFIWVARYVIFNRFMFGVDETNPAASLTVPGEVEAIALEEHRSHEHHEHRGGSGAPEAPAQPVDLGAPGR